MINYPHMLEPIFTKLKKHNIRAVIVGGFVRDSLLGIQSKDIDIELYGINSLDKVEKLLETFGVLNSVGKSFGVCKLKMDSLEIDFSLPRIETKNSSGHKGFLVTTKENINFRSAALRRDFTINAIGFDITTKTLLDPFHGIKDLKNSLLRCVNEKTFIEDPLRVLRAVQFSARFHLKLHKKLFMLCKSMIQNGALEELSHERVFDEILKLLLKAQTPSLGIILLQRLRIQEYYFKEFHTLSSKEYLKTLKAVNRMAHLKTENKKRDTLLMLSTLTYYLSHKDSASFLTKITNEKELLHKVAELKKYTLKKNMSNQELYTLALHVNLQELITLHIGLYPNQKDIYINLQKRSKALHILENKLPELLQGRDLINAGLKPSVAFKQILQKAYQAQISEEFFTHKEALLWLQKELFT